MDQASALEDEQSLDVTVDLFEQGLDRYVITVFIAHASSNKFPSCHSLGATFLRNRIIVALRKSPNPALANAISQNYVFDHPTIER